MRKSERVTSSSLFPNQGGQVKCEPPRALAGTMQLVRRDPSGTQASSLCGGQASCLRRPHHSAHGPAGWKPTVRTGWNPVFHFAALPQLHRSGLVALLNPRFVRGLARILSLFLVRVRRPVWPREGLRVCGKVGVHVLGDDQFSPHDDEVAGQFGLSGRMVTGAQMHGFTVLMQFIARTFRERSWGCGAFSPAAGKIHAKRRLRPSIYNP